MAPLQKQSILVNFAKGLDTKTDPKQVDPGHFLGLKNSVFQVGNRLTKRNGFGELPSLPAGSFPYLTTFNGNLTALGSVLAAYSQGLDSWVQKGSTYPVSLSTLPLIRNNTNQQQCDAVVADAGQPVVTAGGGVAPTVASNGLVCTVWTDNNGSALSYKYAIADSVTGQNLVAPTAIPVSSGAVSGSPRVFLLGNYFVIVFTNTISATQHLQYIAISVVNPTSVTTAADIASSVVSSTSAAQSWDGVVAGSSLYFAYNTTSGGQAIKVAALSSSLSLGTAMTFSGQHATYMSVTADNTNSGSPIIWASWFLTGTPGSASCLAVDQNLNTVLSPTSITTTASPYLNITSTAQNGVLSSFYEAQNAYSYDAAVATNFIDVSKVTQAGAVTVPATIIRSAGLASKAFLNAGNAYFLAAYSSSYQPTYFLMNATTSVVGAPVIIAKLAYGNGGGYLPAGLPGVSLVNGAFGANALSGGTVLIPYLLKDLVAAVAKVTPAIVGVQQSGVYSQTGISLATFNFSPASLSTIELGENLITGGGFGWGYDGYVPVEQNFFLWPDNIEAVWSATGGAIAAKPDAATNTNAYWYQVTYEWSDNQGNLYRSAPSIPIAVTTSGAGTTGSITINVPTLRLTFKTANPVKIVIYRWSVKNQVYYQTTSISAPTLNNMSADSIAYVDTLADASILGNNILYTTGGVVEDISPPATNVITAFDSRAWLLDAETPNLWWFSKQVTQGTPVEFSDLLTYYVAPGIGSEGPTGAVSAGAPMDDKLIMFKPNAAYYINGSGPDNTGNNSQYSQPIFITSTVGCANQASIVLIPDGLMFQSNKGIWLLGRDLSTHYIGAPVEAFNSATVLSAVVVPNTTQVRFTLDSGVTLMYDYFYGEWGTFIGIPGISSTLYQGLHTYIDKYGRCFQETPGLYLDGSNPVLMGFTTAWIQFARLNGFQRAYFFYLLGTYLSPHKLSVSIAYDFNPSAAQAPQYVPGNYAAPYGSTQIPYYGGDGSTAYGGPNTVENPRIFFDRGKCESFQISVQELFDPTLGTVAGPGLTISGVNIIGGAKKMYRPVSAANSVG